VETTWARRIPNGEQSVRKLPDYAIGEHFIHSIEALQGITADKVADVVTELLTGIAESSAGREMHRLRTARVATTQHVSVRLTVPPAGASPCS
jgi:hypothetical protein